MAPGPTADDGAFDADRIMRNYPALKIGALLCPPQTLIPLCPFPPATIHASLTQDSSQRRISLKTFMARHARIHPNAQIAVKILLASWTPNSNDSQQGKAVIVLIF